MRMIVVAYRQDVHQQEIYTPADEQHMVLAGFLGFPDPAKPDAKEAIGLLGAHGVRVKVLTGDNAIITQHVAEEVGIANQLVATGDDVDAMDDSALRQAVETTDLFVKLSPMQKPESLKPCVRPVTQSDTWVMASMILLRCVKRMSASAWIQLPILPKMQAALFCWEKAYWCWKMGFSKVVAFMPTL